MAGKIRVALASLASVAVLVGATALHQLPAAASTPGSLFGLAFYAGQVVRIDPASGQYTVLTTLPVDPSGISMPSFFGLVADAPDHKLFTIRATYNDPTFQTQLWQVVTIDTTSGSTTVSPALSQSLNSGLLADWAFDPSSGDLFGVVSPMVGPRVVKIDPATGVVTRVADLPALFVSGVTFAADKHDLFVAGENNVNLQAVWSVLTVDTVTGAVSTSPALNIGLLQLIYDSSSGTLFGKGGYPNPSNSIFRVDPATGGETAIAPALGFSFEGIAIDSASHTIYLTDDEFTGFGPGQFIESINDQTGAYSDSTGNVGTGQFVFNLAFVGVVITPASVRAEVQQGFASGAITSQGVEDALLHRLDAAAAARARGQCGVASNIYSALINTVQALSGDTQTASDTRTGEKINPSFASQLISDIRYLIGHCP